MTVGLPYQWEPLATLEDEALFQKQAQHPLP